MIYICILSITSMWNEETKKLMHYVSATRQKKIEKYQRDSDKKLSLFAALLCRMQVSKYTNIPNEELYFSCINHDKPALVSDLGCYFNVSHAGNKILLAVSSEPIGVDIETLVDVPLDMMDVVFHPEEKRYVRNGKTRAEQNLRFFQIWTQKEALLKQMGVGLKKNPVLYNTFSRKYCANYISGYDGEYVYAIYAIGIKKIHYVRLEEDEIVLFFSEIVPGVRRESYF